jgi:hypothetical protein
VIDTTSTSEIGLGWVGRVGLGALDRSVRTAGIVSMGTIREQAIPAS